MLGWVRLSKNKIVPVKYNYDKIIVKNLMLSWFRLGLD